MKEVEKYTNELGQWIVEYAQGQLKVFVRKRKKETTGTLGKSLYYRPIRRGNNLRIDLGSSVPYGIVVHNGRKAGKQPPTSAIETWMKKKPIRLRDRETGAFIKATPKLRRQVAFLIARKIGRDGTPAYPYFSQAVERSFTHPDAVRIWGNLGKEYVRFYLKK